MFLIYLFFMFSSFGVFRVFRVSSLSRFSKLSTITIRQWTTKQREDTKHIIKVHVLSESPRQFNKKKSIYHLSVIRFVVLVVCLVSLKSQQPNNTMNSRKKFVIVKGNVVNRRPKTTESQIGERLRYILQVQQVRSWDLSFIILLDREQKLETIFREITVYEIPLNYHYRIEYILKLNPSSTCICLCVVSVFKVR